MCSSTYMGKLDEEKKRRKENCVHVAFLKNKNRHQIVDERIDADPQPIVKDVMADHGDARGLIRKCILSSVFNTGSYFVSTTVTL